MDVTDALCFASARDLAQQIRSRQISARELMTASLARITRLNPTLNAIVAKLDDAGTGGNTIFRIDAAGEAG